MKIYTKTGDSGETSLLGGTRVSKSDLRIEAYGSVDELNSWLGVIRDAAGADFNGSTKRIQNVLFSIGSNLAADPAKSKVKLPEVSGFEIKWLEDEMDKMNEDLSELRNFILPGGDLLVSYTHVARCVCRRAERSSVRLSDAAPVSEVILMYLNRLSDYLFVLSRSFSKLKNAEETPWISS